jgi:hypothetical protein
MGGTRKTQICLAFSAPHGAPRRRSPRGFTYRNAMSVVRSEIIPSELGIAEMRPRRAVTGALIFEITGQDASSKASRLAEKMAGTLRDLPAKVTVPRRIQSPRRRSQPPSPRRGLARSRRSAWALYAPLPGASARYGALPVDSGKKTRRQHWRGRRRSWRQAPHRMVSGEGLL